MEEDGGREDEASREMGMEPRPQMDRGRNKEERRGSGDGRCMGVHEVRQAMQVEERPGDAQEAYARGVGRKESV